MKQFKYIISTIILTFIVSCGNSKIEKNNSIELNSEYKKYMIKRAKIEYNISSSGSVIGVKMETKGKKRLIFDNYGFNELTEEYTIENIESKNNKKIKKRHTLNYINGVVIYSVDFNKKLIYRSNDPTIATSINTKFPKEFIPKNENIIHHIDSKKTGTDVVLGYICDIWEMMGTKQCIYKGIPLKIESNVMGVKSLEIATDIKFNKEIENIQFNIPDFPIMSNHKIITKDKIQELDITDNIKAMNPPNTI